MLTPFALTMRQPSWQTFAICVKVVMGYTKVGRKIKDKGSPFRGNALRLLKLNDHEQDDIDKQMDGHH